MSRVWKFGLPAFAAALLAGCISNAPKEQEVLDPFEGYSTEEILTTGDQAFSAEEYDRALFLYKQALDVEETAETWYSVGVTKVRLDDDNSARQAFLNALELDPEHAPSHEEIGLLYISFGQPEAAVSHLTKATQLDENRWRAYNALGVIADVDGRHADAATMYMAALKANPDSAMLMNNIGYSFYLAGNLQESTHWFDRAIQVDPNYAPAVKNLALLYARQGWYDEAVNTFKKVMDEPQAYNDAGYFAMRNGDLEEASKLLTKAIRLSPIYYELAHQNLAEVRIRLESNTARNDMAALAGTGLTQIIFPDSRDKKYRKVMPQALNLRAEPDTESEIVAYLKTGDMVEIIVSQPGWAFVSFTRNGNIMSGWVNDRFLASTPGIQPTTPQADGMAGSDIVPAPAASSPELPAQTE
jgi:Flp pilus assembly protein TadD